MALQLFKIASTTVETPVTSVSFSSIPQGYTDLKLVGSVRGSRSSAYVINLSLTFNSSTTSYSDVFMYDNSGTVSTGKDTNYSSYAYIYGTADNATTNAFSSFEVYIPNYTSSNYKSFSSDTVMESNTSSFTLPTLLGAGLWSNTSAISSLSIGLNNGTSINANSTLTLYGVL